MAEIKFDHAVIYNGVLYPANTPIEEKKTVAKATVSETEKVEAPKKATKKAGVKGNDNGGTI